MALRAFLVGIPGTLDRASDSLGRLVVLAAIGLSALLLLALFGRHEHRPPPPVGQGENPAGALFVRDLGRLSDGRHTFDLVYELVLRDDVGRAASVAFTEQRLSIGDPAPPGDVVDMGHAITWHPVVSRRDAGSDQPTPDRFAGHWRAFRAHYRINARPDQFANVAIGYGLRHDRHGWFGPADRTEDDGHNEDVQLGVVLRAHCALGVKIQYGEVRSLCGS